ncbi:MAG: toprim domain-containing protein, partial [Caulobacterales bacterium]|uniref:toprim domain-containing protein n=1 Tax=Glycocaulis sp. TaxID=1969725 RepID=UPI003FA06EE7
AFHQMQSLRFHPPSFYGPEGGGPIARLPAMLAAITDLEGRHTGTHRTWLRPDGSAKADVDTPRRAMGTLLGNGVRFGAPADVLIAGEGIETVLSVRSALPEIPALAALSSGHLAAIRFPAGLRRLYVLRDRDPAGAAARDRLEARAAETGIEAVTLTPRLGDFNDDLRRYGLAALQARLRLHLHVEDAARSVPV